MARCHRPLLIAVTLFGTGCTGGGGNPPDAVVLVGPVNGPTTEAGGQASFTVTLGTKPSGDVTFALASADTSEGTVSPATLTFTPDNFAAPQTVLVTGADDDEVDGTASYAITIGAPATEDKRYAAIDPADPIVVNVDDETAGVRTALLDGSTSEGGEQASFTVVLDARPAADVTISVSSSDEGEGAPSSQTLLFTTLDWNAPQTVTVTGADDELADGAQSFEIALAAASADPNYDGIAVSPVALVNVDDDSAAILVSSPSSAATTEAGGTVTFTVRLASQPTSDVTVSFDTNDSTEGVPNVTSLVFTPVDFGGPKTVTVTGINDAVADGSQTYSIVFGATASADADYAGLVPASIPLSNGDDDSPGIVVSPISGGTTEAGGQATFTIALASQPTASVTVNFGTNDTSEGIPNVTSRTFSTTNYSSPQTVTITGQNDDVADGNQVYAITFSATTSADPKYAGRVPPNIPITNYDDDSAGIAVSHIGGATSEAGGSVTFSIVLRSQPTATVNVNFASSDTTEGVTSVSSRSFTTANWNVAQFVTVTGVDDLLLDGDQLYQITFGATTSSDPKYAAIVPPSIPVTNIGDDLPRKVLIVHANATASHVADVESKLEATGSFEAVDVWDASATTPSQAELGLYASVLVMNDTAPWSSATMLGDRLANHFDAGNQVVLANFTHSAGIGGSAIGGRFATTGTNGYMLLDAAAPVLSGAATLGTAGVPGHFLLRDVTSLSASTAHRNGSGALDGVETIAWWSDGTPLVVARTYPNGRVRADVNFSAPSNTALSGSWTGSGAELLRNALLYTEEFTAPPPPPADPTPDVGYYSMSGAGQGDSTQVQPIMDAGGIPVNLTNLTSADLAGLEVLFVWNPDNGTYLSEYTARLSEIDAAVQAGMTLIIHDRYVSAAESILPGGSTFVINRALGASVQILDATTLVTNGPGGVLDNSSLDGGNSSTHGYAVSSSLPGEAKKILSTASSAEVVTFAYPRGAGWVIYSSIPLDYYFTQPDTGVAARMRDYGTNVVAYGIQLAQD